MHIDKTFAMIMRETSLSLRYFASSFASDVASRIAELPLADVCEQGGTPVDASVNVDEIEFAPECIRAKIDVIFNERFPLGCGSTLTDRVRRVQFAIQLDRATRICTFTRMDDADETDL